MNDLSIYDADYYLRGKQTGKSLYEDYRWLPKLTIPMCQAVATYLGIQKHHTILDFGCARGYTVKAFHHIGHVAYGLDASEWAIENCDPEVRDFVRLGSQIHDPFDWIVAKDVLEHVPQAADTVSDMLKYARVGIFAVVPLASVDGGKYVLSDYEKDITHVHRLPLISWGRFFLQRGWDVTLSYRVPGIKDNHYCPAWEPGDGFIIARRI